MSKSIGVFVFTTILLSALSKALTQENYDKYGNVPDPLSDVLNKYENPFFNVTDETNTYRRVLSKRSPNFLNEFIFKESGKTKNRRLSEISDIRDTIHQKIIQLMPILDDGKTSEGKNKDFDGNNDEALAQDIINKKYKTLRKDVEKLLKIEPITSNTKLSVIQALDQIESELKDNGCALKKIREDVIRRRHLQAREPSIVIPKHLEQDVLNDIKEKWNKIVIRYSMEDSKNNNETANKVAFLFLTRLRQFVFDIHEDYKKLQDTFKIKCRSDKKSNVPIFKQSNAKQERALEQDDTCNDLVICSLELLHFLADFYNQLNETYVETINNYMEMYVREVDADDAEKETFKDILDMTLDYGGKKIQLMFTKELEKFKEFLNGTSTRTVGLRNFIDRTINNTKEIIYDCLTLQLKKLKPQLRYTVKQDISTSAGIELGNLQNIYKDKMCIVFKTCNGDVTLRKNNKIGFKSVDPNDIKIKLRVDKPLEKKNVYEKNYRREKNILEIGKVSARKLNKIKYFNMSEYKHVINVTRTTYAEYIEKGTTELIGSLQTQENVTEPNYAEYIEKGTTKLMGNSAQTHEDVTQPLVIYF